MFFKHLFIILDHSVLIVCVNGFVLIGFELEFYCLNTNFTELNDFQLYTLLNFLQQHLPYKSFVLKREKSYGQLEFASDVIIINTKNDFNIIDNYIQTLKLKIITHCKNHNLYCFFVSLPLFVKNQKFRNFNITQAKPLIASSLQVSVSSTLFDYKAFVSAFLNATYNKNNISIFLPTKNCKERIGFINNQNCPQAYKLVVPNKICWGYKENRSTAVRVVKLSPNDNYRVEYRVASSICNPVRLFDILFEGFNENLNTQNNNNIQISDPIYTNAFEDNNLKEIIQ